MPKPSTKAFRRSQIAPYATLSILGIVLAWAWISFGIQKTQGDWWFEDDACTYMLSAGRDSPLEFFYKKDKGDKLIRVGSGNHLLPLLMVSTWLDSRLAFRSSRLAYLHQALSFLAVALALYFLVRKWLKSELLALTAGILWMMIPSSLVLNEFLSMRSYLEGLLAGLIAWLCLLHGEGGNPGRRRLAAAGCLLAASISLLCKDYFPTTLLLSLFLYAGYRRRPATAAGLVLIGTAYLLYRAWAVGIGLQYSGIPFLGLTDYLRFLSRLPFMLTGNIVGYPLVALWVFGLLWVSRKSPKDRLELAFLSLVLVSALATIYPVSGPVLSSWQDHGTWYRSVFLLNTVFLLFCVRLASLVALPCYRQTLIVTALAGLAHGGMVTVQKWDALKLSNELEGRFIIGNDERLLYSELPAPWYLPCIKGLYWDHGGGHFLQGNAAIDRALLERFGTIWVRRDRKVVEDPELFERLHERSK